MQMPQDNLIPQPTHNEAQNDRITMAKYEEYKKLYASSYQLHLEIYSYEQKNKQLLQTLNIIQKNLSAFLTSEIQEEEVRDEKKKEGSRRSRRRAEDISRGYECGEDFCGKKYGAHASLLQHVKIKHPESFKKYI